MSPLDESRAVAMISAGEFDAWLRPYCERCRDRPSLTVDLGDVWKM